MIPDQIVISRDQGARLETIGTYGDGNQFMAFVVTTRLEKPLGSVDNLDDKRWYAVRHTFAADGSHLETIAWFAGTSVEGEALAMARANAKLEELLAELGLVTFDDVRIRLFQAVIDGQIFGLVDMSEDGWETVELQPNGLGFIGPWEPTASF